MSRAVSLGQLKADVQEQSNIAGATTRYAATLLTRQINQSIQRFREKVSTEGVTRFLVPVSGTMAAGQASHYPFGLVNLASVATNVVRPYGLDIRINGEVRTLQFVPFDQRAEFGGGTVRGVPVAWSMWGENNLAIFPPPDTSYPYTAWVLPSAADLVNDADTFDGVAGWEDFVTWDVVCRIIVRDQYGEAYQMAVSYRSDIWADIMRGAQRVTSAGGAVVGRDSFGERLGYMRTGRRGELPPP